MLAGDRVRYVGEPAALVVADTAEQAVDAAEWVALEIEELPAVVDPATAESSPPLHTEAPANVVLRWRHAQGDVAGAFARASAVARARVRAPRLIAAPLEPRAVLAAHDLAKDMLTLWLSAQDQHRQLAGLAAVLRRPRERLRVIVPDVGGAFGSKGVAPRRRRPRSRSRRSARPAGEVDGDANRELTRGLPGARRGGRRRARARRRGTDAGAAGAGARRPRRLPLLDDAGTPHTAATLLAGCYAIPAAEVEVVGVCTNKVPTGPYRGAGRPEAALAIERLVDLAAAETGLDRVEIRRRNAIPPEAFPYATVLGYTYDSGDYLGALDDALELAGWDGLLASVTSPRRAGSPGSARPRRRAGRPRVGDARLTLEADGPVVLRTGSSPHGQGHETTFAQIVAAELGIEPSAVEVRWGDSAEIPGGTGTFASRSVTVGGSAALLAAREGCGHGSGRRGGRRRSRPGSSSRGPSSRSARRSPRSRSTPRPAR